jgi:tripartite ATP-independent transporter DctP family solute receptor
MMKRRDFLSHAAVAGAALAGGRALAADPVTVKIATVAPDGTPWADQMRSFKARVEAAGAGRLKLKPFLGGALGDENGTASETKRGSIHIWAGSSGALASVVPELALFELPYLFRNYAEADHVIDQVLFEDMKKAIEAKGLKLLFWSENGYRSFGTTFGPVTKPEHLKGKKMRSQESDAHLEMYRVLGASPVPIAVTEVLSALQTGVVDGFDNTPLFTFAASWHRGIKHYSVTEAIYQPGLVVANKEWFDKCTPDEQKALVADQPGEASRGRKGVRDLAPLLIENFKNDKIAVHTLTDAEKESFAKLCEPVHAKWAASKGKAAAPMLKKAKAALEAMRKKG